MADFLQLLYRQAPLAEFDRVLSDAQAAGTDDDELRRLGEEYDVALRLRDLIARAREREAELSALYETARDLTGIRDVDTILAAIVRRARQLLSADMTYLSLNDESEGASYMKVTDGALTREFRELRLPLGTGLLGLVAQTGAPYFTSDYQADDRFLHQRYIDDAVDGENIRAILGVPLLLDGHVIGALLAVHRRVREFPPQEVSVLTSFAAHATVALENARIFAELASAHVSMRAHTEAVEAAALAHDRLTDLLLHGEGVADVTSVLADVIGGEAAIVDSAGAVLSGEVGLEAEDLTAATAESVRSGHAVAVRGGYVAAALAPSEHVATLIVHGLDRDLDGPERRTLERAALVTALMLLFARSVAEAEERLGGELLADLLAGRAGDPMSRRERARRQGADLEGPLAVLVVQAEDRAPAARHALRFAAGRRGLAGVQDGRVVVVVPDPDPVAAGRAFQELAGAVAGAVTVGVAAGEVERLVEAWTRASECATTLIKLGRTGQVSDPQGLGLSRLLLGDNGPDALAGFVEDALGVLQKYDDDRGASLVATLSGWFDHGQRLRETAEALHVHHNTVVQRLDRIGELLGPGWRDADRLLDLQIALRLHRLMGD